MAFTRFKDDPARVNKYLEETTSVGKYHLNTPGNGLNMPFVEDPHIRLQKWGANLYSNGTDIENELRCSTRKLSSDYQVYNKKLVPGLQKYYNNSTFYIDESRASCPAWLFRDKTQYRPQILDKNPQYKDYLIHYQVYLNDIYLHL